MEEPLVKILNSIDVSAESLREALELAVAEKKSTIPVLTHVLLQPSTTGIRVVSTDLDLTVLTDIEGSAANETRILIPFRKVFDLLKGEKGRAYLSYRETVETVNERKRGEYKDDEWVEGEEFEREDRSFAIVLEVGSVSYEVAAMNAANFPVSPEIGAPQFHIPSPEFKGMLSRAVFAISKEESRYTLNGLLLRAEKGKVLIAATDGHRMAVETLELAQAKKAETIIPTPAITWLSKHLDKLDAGIHIGEEYAVFSLPNIHSVLIARKVKGQFPNYEAVMPRQDAIRHTATFPAGDGLAKVLTKVTQMADGRSGAVKWNLNGACELSAHSSENGKATAAVEANVTHRVVDGDMIATADEVAIGLNSSYVLDFLKIAGKNPVTMSLKDGASAALLEVPSIPGYSYILMPMRL